MSAEDPELIDHPAGRFIGREFLLWLWWRTDREFGRVELAQFGEVDFWVDDRIQFRTTGDDPQTSDLKGGAPAMTPEARMAVLSGKSVETLRLGLRVKEREYSLEIRGEGLEVGGLKVPGEIKDGIDERIYERMFLLEEATGILDTLYYEFLDERLGAEWDSGALPEIRSWIAAGT